MPCDTDKRKKGTERESGTELKFHDAISRPIVSAEMTK